MRSRDLRLGLRSRDLLLGRVNVRAKLVAGDAKRGFDREDESRRQEAPRPKVLMDVGRRATDDPCQL